jgi:outer membrane protein assembly factor BamB
MSLAYQINENEIMVMGGKSQLSNIITKNTYVLNMETGKFKDGPTLGNPSSFMNTTLVFNNEIFVYGNDNNIHKFSFVEHQWSIFKKRPKNNR